MPLSLSPFLKDCKPKSRTMLGENPVTSTVTSMTISGILPKYLTFQGSLQYLFYNTNIFNKRLKGTLMQI